MELVTHCQSREDPSYDSSCKEQHLDIYQEEGHKVNAHEFREIPVPTTGAFVYGIR